MLRLERRRRSLRLGRSWVGVRLDDPRVSSRDAHVRGARPRCHFHRDRQPAKAFRDRTGGIIARLTPFRSEQPVTFEFLAISDGTNEPVEFYYGPTPNSTSSSSACDPSTRPPSISIASTSTSCKGSFSLSSSGLLNLMEAQMRSGSLIQTRSIRPLTRTRRLELTAGQFGQGRR